MKKTSFDQLYQTILETGTAGRIDGTGNITSSTAPANPQFSSPTKSTNSHTTTQTPVKPGASFSKEVIDVLEKNIKDPEFQKLIMKMIEDSGKAASVAQQTTQQA